MDLLRSKKFQAALIGLLVVVGKHYIPGLDEVTATTVLAPFIAYILGQALADALPGKEKVIAETAAKLYENDE